MSKRRTKQTRTENSSSQSSTSSQSKLTKQQLFILILLASVACTIWFGMAIGIYIKRDVLFEQTTESIAVESPTKPPLEIEVDSTHTPVPTEPSEPTPTLTSVLPQTEATIEPTPTATYAVAPEFINKDKIAEISRYVEQVRQLSLSEQLPTKFLTRAQFVEEWKSNSVDRALIEAAETQFQLYVALGLIDPEIALAEITEDHQTRSLMGYYTPDDKTMYIIADSVNMFAQEEMTFAHEYVHALQDQYFDLGRILAMDGSADALLAARSLPEGDARFVENLFTMQNVTRDQLQYGAYRYMLNQPPALEGVSPALGIFTFFPYTAGEYFVIYLFIEGGFSWDKVNEAYKNPPISSEQVIHPEKYLAGEQPVNVTLPDLSPALDEGWRELGQNVLGEVGLWVWLIDQVEEPEMVIDAAAGWDGDRYSLWMNDTGQHLFVQVSVWESTAEANEFFEIATSTLHGRHSNATTKAEDGLQTWEYEDGITQLRWRGNNQVTLIIAPAAEVLTQISPLMP